MSRLLHRSRRNLLDHFIGVSLCKVAAELAKIGEALITIGTRGGKEAAFVAVKVCPHAN